MATEERVKLLVAARRGIYEDVVSLSKIQIPLGDYVQPPYNRTALWYSCKNGSLKMAKIILKKGSNINHKDINGVSPLHMCAKYGHVVLMKFLIENNADLNIKDNEGQTPIFYAIQNKHYEAVKLLVESGANVNIKDNNNVSIYDYADFTGKQNLSNYILFKSNEESLKNSEDSTSKS